MTRHIFSNAQINKARESHKEDDRCAYKWMFMAQDTMLETMADESMTLFVKARDLSGALGDITQQLFDIQQEMKALNLKMNQLSYYKNREDQEGRMYE